MYLSDAPGGEVALKMNHLGGCLRAVMGANQVSEGRIYHEKVVEYWGNKYPNVGIQTEYLDYVPKGGSCR